LDEEERILTKLLREEINPQETRFTGKRELKSYKIIIKKI
jgi:hypothetical protein